MNAVMGCQSFGETPGGDMRMRRYQMAIGFLMGSVTMLFIVLMVSFLRDFSGRRRTQESSAGREEGIRADRSMTTLAPLAELPLAHRSSKPLEDSKECESPFPSWRADFWNDLSPGDREELWRSLAPAEREDLLHHLVRAGRKESLLLPTPTVRADLLRGLAGLWEAQSDPTDSP